MDLCGAIHEIKGKGKGANQAGAGQIDDLRQFKPFTPPPGQSFQVRLGGRGKESTSNTKSPRRDWERIDSGILKAKTLIVIDLGARKCETSSSRADGNQKAHMSDQSTTRKIIPGLVWYRPFEPFAYAFIRFCTGAILVAHGANRLFYGGTVAELGEYLGRLPASAIGAFELIGGAMIALGILTRPIALLFVLEWTAIAAAAPIKPGTSWLMLGATPHYPALVAAMCFAFLLRGGGYYSVDRRVGKEI